MIKKLKLSLEIYIKGHIYEIKNLNFESSFFGDWRYGTITFWLISSNMFFGRVKITSLEMKSLKYDKMPIIMP